MSRVRSPSPAPECRKETDRPPSAEAAIPFKTLNEVYSSLSTRRRYEVWFLRLGLADGSGAWWFRYLLMNPGRPGCSSDSRGMPVQVWATWFPAAGKPQTFIQGFSLNNLELSGRGSSPFHLRIGDCEIGEDFCRGSLQVDGHQISWDLHYRSEFHFTLSSKGWIGFSRTPHSDAVFSGQIAFDGQSFSGEPLGFGVQGHNCGYRHRGFWTWAHAYFPRAGSAPSTLEALIYDMPLGFVFRKAVLWHEAKQYEFRNLRETEIDAREFHWRFAGRSRDGLLLDADFQGDAISTHRLPYLRTDCYGSFEVANNSLARSLLWITQADGRFEELSTPTGAVLEMVGSREG